MPRYLDIEILGVQQVRRKLLRGAERAGRMRPALVEIRELIWEAIRLNFDAQGARTGTPWVPISEEWLRRKADKGWDERILFARHRLYEAFSGRTRYTRSTAYHDRIVIDSNLPYANVQNYGDEDRNIPARPFVKFTKQDRQAWVRVVEAHLMGAMK